MVKLNIISVLGTMTFLLFISLKKKTVDSKSIDGGQCFASTQVFLFDLNHSNLIDDINRITQKGRWLLDELALTRILSEHGPRFKSL